MEQPLHSLNLPTNIQKKLEAKNVKTVPDLMMLMDTAPSTIKNLLDGYELKIPSTIFLPELVETGATRSSQPDVSQSIAQRVLIGENSVNATTLSEAYDFFWTHSQLFMQICGEPFIATSMFGLAVALRGLQLKFNSHSYFVTCQKFSFDHVTRCCEKLPRCPPLDLSRLEMIQVKDLDDIIAAMQRIVSLIRLQQQNVLVVIVDGLQFCFSQQGTNRKSSDILYRTLFEFRRLDIRTLFTNPPVTGIDENGQAIFKQALPDYFQSLMDVQAVFRCGNDMGEPDTIMFV